MNKGFTLIDVLVGTMIVTIIFVGIFSGFQLLFKILSQSQDRLIALGLANEQIETIRNLTYINIGTENGIPAGQIPQSKTETVGNRAYTVKTDIIYIDDPFDDIAPADSLSADYKKARIEVSWTDHESNKSIVQTANFSPPNLESEVGGGVLSLYVNDRESGAAIGNALVEISNDQVAPNVHLTTVTDDQGWLNRPGLPASDEYQISVTQAGYDEHRTYGDSATLDPEPEYSHAQIIEGEKTTRYLLIAETGAINVSTVNDQNDPLANISFSLRGGRAIGVNPIDQSVVYSYQNDTLETNGLGEKQLAEMSAGEYYFAFAEPGYAVLTPNLERPIILESGSQQAVVIALASTDQPYLRALVKDQETGDGLPDATVRLNGAAYDKTTQSNEDGIALFPFDAAVLLNGPYTLSVSKPGYEGFTGPQTIDNFTEQIILLNPGPHASPSTL